ncbi:enoyl-CoA hydratase/isomerase family protein [Limnohabitans sp. Rim28]|uniref:enoyl-CoA hydratase/isomerase family protein n=1 Tax=Limnohabitans sp. Rim28 TaxID=1100720 RepID=UPI0002DB00A8|nr:enoyl-CoA hydratase/isomerase family protein [Limnohabitans sp. Rim28]PVE09366.1 3-hydroxyisobutyryl-CoA hydrolase [Limnohabitans sp. Rim28]
MSDVIVQIEGRIGCITLNRPRALNALSLEMVRLLTDALMAWKNEPQVLAVAVRGMGKEGPFGSFCAGGDIRFFHQAAVASDAALAEFFTEEYRLNHLIHTYSKPYIAFMDGIVMGGGMGISQGASVRVVTERTKMAMPETHIGLFPDVGGGYFLSRCPGRLGEYLGLTGQMLSGPQAVAAKLADIALPSGMLEPIWNTLTTSPFENAESVERWVLAQAGAMAPEKLTPQPQMDDVFGLPSIADMLAKLESATDEWSQKTAHVLRHRSPLMLHVVLEQIRRARQMSLADDLRMERDMVHHCFHLRAVKDSETVEGIRALAVDKDHKPQWKPDRVEEVDRAEAARFFVSPWTAEQHPLRDLN